jgi:hypothetical protein
MSWQPIETAPRGFWIEAAGNNRAITHPVIWTDEVDGEEGWWEDETGDYHVDAPHNNGNGLHSWRPLKPSWRPEPWMGTNRLDDPTWVAPSHPERR